MRPSAFVRGILFVCSIAALPARAGDLPHFWSRADGAGSADFGNALAADADGNVVIAGQFAGTVDFGGGPLASSGSTDAFVVKTDRDGSHVWTRAFGSSGADFGNGVAVDAAGNVVVAGTFRNTVDFGGGPIASNGQTDGFVARYDANGIHLWSRALGGTGFDSADDVSIDPATGDVLVVGSFVGSADFGAGVVSASGNDGFVVRIAVDGTTTWSRALGGGGYDVAYAVVGAPGSTTVVAGSFQGSADLGGGFLSSAGSSDVYLVGYDIDGLHRWSRRYGGAGIDEPYDLDVTPAGGLALSGYVSAATDLGGGPLATTGGRDAFVASYDGEGGHVWSRLVGGTDNDWGYGVAADARGRITLVASVIATVDFGTGPLTSAGLSDVGFGVYDADGTPLHAALFGAAGQDEGLDVAADPDANLLLTGGFRETVDFGGGPSTSAGNADVFVVKLGADPVQPSIRSITDVANDQGRAVRLRFDRSGFDAPGTPSLVLRYEAYRRIEGSGAGETAWEQVGSVSAHGQTDYSMIVPTLVDSTIVDGLQETTFLVRAATGDPFSFYDSAPDSGYSVDNLAPEAPQNLLLAAGVLTWDESGAPDFDYFTVYGSDSADFDGTATAIGTTVAPSRAVGSGSFAYYYVTGTDFSGNESEATRTQSATGVDGPAPSPRAALSAFPNPFNPRTTLQFEIPEAGTARVRVFDLSGAEVVTLVERRLSSGLHTVDWDGTDAAGRRVATGVYLVRVEAAGHAAVTKIGLVK